MVKNLTQGKPMRVLLSFALPMLIGNIFQQFYNLADTIIVGQFIGSNALAAVGSTFPVTFFALGIATGASVGCGIIISKDFGSGNKRIKKSISTALIFVSSIGLVIMILSLFLLKPFLQFLGTPSNIIDDSYRFLRIVFIGCFFMYIYNCLTAIFNSLGDSKTPLKFLMVSTVLNVILDIILIKFLNFDITGAAIATLSTQIAVAISLFIYFLKKLPKLNFEKQDKLFDFNIAKEMTIIAVPSIIQQVIVSIGMMAVQGLVNSYGKDFIAGYSASTKIDAIAIIPMLSISVALSTFVAQNAGARKTERVSEGYKVSLRLVALFSFITSTVLYFFGNHFIGLFISKNDADLFQVIKFGNAYFKSVSLFYLILGIMFCSNGLLRGIGKMKLFMFCTFVNIAARIILAYALTPFMGYMAIFWALPIGWLLSGIFSTIYIFRGKWKQNL